MEGERRNGVRGKMEDETKGEEGGELVSVWERERKRKMGCKPSK